MKKVLFLILAVLAAAVGAIEPVRTTAPDGGTSDAKEFLGFSVRFPWKIQPFFYEISEFSARKLNKLCKTEIKIEKDDPCQSDLRYFLPTFGFCTLNGSRDTFGVRFGLAERNALAADSGLNLALFVSDLKQMNGFQISPFIGKTKTLYGFQILPFLAYTGNGCGVQTSLNSVAGETFCGLQISALGSFGTDFKGLQIGGFAGLAENCSGVQISGLANLAENRISGVQISGFGNQTDHLNGVQIGLYNRAENGGKGVQFGLLNYMKGAPLPWFPFFNFQF